MCNDYESNLKFELLSVLRAKLALLAKFVNSEHKNHFEQGEDVKSDLALSMRQLNQIWHYWREYLALLEGIFGTIGGNIWHYWRKYLALLEGIFDTIRGNIWHYWREYLALLEGIVPYHGGGRMR